MQWFADRSTSLDEDEKREYARTRVFLVLFFELASVAVASSELVSRP